MDHQNKLQYTLGIDLGTSGVKAGLLNLATLELEFVSMREYDDSPEQDPNVLWNQALAAIKESVRSHGGDVHIGAIGLSGQMHGAVLYDSDDQIIHALINWKDQKWSPGTIIEKMKLVMGDRKYDELGTEISSGYSGAILYGIKENDPELFKRTAHFVLPTDFLRGMLLGKNSHATDPTNAFGTGLFDARLNCWHEELIQKLQLPLNIFPTVQPTSQKAGVIADRVADQAGVERKIPIIIGGGDNQMSMLGSGLTGPGSPILINIGTAAQISKVTAKFERYPGTDTRPFFNKSYAVVGASLGGGGSYQWLREQIRQAGGTDIDYQKMDQLAEEVPAGANGLIFCTGPTRQIPGRPRGFFGNTAMEGSIGHRARAVLEGVLMDLYASYEILRKDDPCRFVLGAGKGLQNSRAWSQIAADLFGKPVRFSGFENAVLGAALMAAYGIGAIKNLEESAKVIDDAAEVTPQVENAQFYQDRFIHDWRAEVHAV